MARLDPIKHIIVLMMENRSFDHMLGYLAQAGRPDVDGIPTGAAWLAAHANLDHGTPVQSFASTNPYSMPADFDPPHERPDVAANLGALTGTTYAMNGFVGSIPDKISSVPAVRDLTMSFFPGPKVPMTDFFAANFTICDRWFSALPAGTQPNRLMAMGGESMIDLNQTVLPEQDLVYDWLTRAGVRWRVYHQGIPFFTMMPKWIPDILGETTFKDFSEFGPDILNTPPDSLPQVIFIEPTYQDAPHLGRSTDDHAPAGVADGQEFMMQVYNAVTADPTFWSQCLLIVDYDEHGGFFDHVSPPPVPTVPPAGATYPSFTSLGVRTPGFIISPFVEPAATSHAVLDHTSVLKLLGEKFGPNGSYSPAVDQRAVESLSAVLQFDQLIASPPAAPSLAGYLAARPRVAATITIPPNTTSLTNGFAQAADQLRTHGATPSHPKFGNLVAQLNLAKPLPIPAP